MEGRGLLEIYDLTSHHRKTSLNFLHEEDIKRNSKKKKMEARGLWKSMTSPVTISKLH